MIASIPASQLVNVLPGVLGTGGNPPALNAVFLTEDPSIPIGTVQAFPNAVAVADWFGPNAQETLDANVYFSGFENAQQLPGTLYFAQFNASAVSAYLRSASFANLPLTAIQGLSGTLTIAIDGETVTASDINLSSATSFTNAAALIQAAIQTAGSIFSGTGTVVNASPTLTINSTVSGELHVGDTVVGTDIPPNTTILSFGTYTVIAGTGTVTMSANATGGAGPEAVTVTSAATCSYDNLRDAFVIESSTTGVNSAVAFPTTNALSTGLQLTAATGAVQSPGAAAATPASCMNGVVAAQQNWATFMTVFEPDGGVGTTNKLAFASWVSTATPAGAERFCYVAWDPSLTPTTGAAPESFAQLVVAAGYNGVVPVFDQSSGLKAAFICGCAASIDFSQPNGRITFAYKGQAGLVPDVTSATVAQNLIANAYNFYGQYATATQQFQFLQPGSMPGEWNWIDPYIDQIWLNQSIVAAIMQLLTNIRTLPYNNQGYALIRSAVLDPINAALNAGVIVSGVALSAAQQQEINNDAGANIAQTIITQGYYLQILPATASIRGARTSPPMTLWYTDGGSVQQIELDSIDIE
jgi:hypothetical protein